MESTSPSLQELAVWVKELSHTVKQQEGEILQLKETVHAQQTLLTALANTNVTTMEDTEDFVVFDDITMTTSFTKFLDCNKKAQERVELQQKKAQMEKLFSIFGAMKKLDIIGKKNEHIFACISRYIEILRILQPAENEWTWTQWWSSTNKLTLSQINEKLQEFQKAENNEELSSQYATISTAIADILTTQEEYKKSATTWQLYLSSADPAADQVKTLLSNQLDKSGIDICQKLETSIRELDEEPGKFIEDHIESLMGEDVSVNEKEKLKQFAEAFTIGNEWVLVSDNQEDVVDINWLTWSLRKVRNNCTVYGYFHSVDHVLDTADEYKATCSKLKRTLEWVYFGGRLAVDPTGAVLSLLW